MSNLLKKDRKELILKQVNVHSRVSFSDLTQSLQVSLDTIRRDLNELAEEKLIIKIRGGAMAKGNEYNSSAISYAVKSKQLIAGKAVSMLKEGMLVLIGGGTTVREFIKLIPDELHACFVTANPYTSIELLEKPNIETILLGGRLSNYSQTVVSGEVFQTLPEIKADLYIMGAKAIDAKEGLTDSEWDIVTLKKAMIKAAKMVVVLAISEKLNSAMKLRLCPIRGIDYLVTELNPESTILAPYRDAGIQVL